MDELHSFTDLQLLALLALVFLAGMVAMAALWLLTTPMVKRRALALAEIQDRDATGWPIDQHGYRLQRRRGEPPHRCPPPRDLQGVFVPQNAQNSAPRSTVVEP